MFQNNLDTHLSIPFFFAKFACTFEDDLCKRLSERTKNRISCIAVRLIIKNTSEDNKLYIINI